MYFIKYFLPLFTLIFEFKAQMHEFLINIVVLIVPIFVYIGIIILIFIYFLIVQLSKQHLEALFMYFFLLKFHY
jgi:hypothetical protein